MKGKKWIAERVSVLDMFEQVIVQDEEEQIAKHLLSNVEDVLINGTEKLLSRVYNRIGFDLVDDKILKYLTIARLSQPMSKSATVNYLKSYFDEDIKLEKVYRYLDKLYNTQREEIQKISVLHTKKVLINKIGHLFYYVITLYFENYNKYVIHM